MTLFARTNTISQTKTRWVNEVFNVSDTFTVPSGVRKINTVVVGGGGTTPPNNTVFSAQIQGGGGGGGVGYNKDIAVSPGEEITIQVGGAGTETKLIASSRTVEAGPGASSETYREWDTENYSFMTNPGGASYSNYRYVQEKSPVLKGGSYYPGCSAGGTGAADDMNSNSDYANRLFGDPRYGNPGGGLALTQYYEDGRVGYNERVGGAGGGGGASQNPATLRDTSANATTQSTSNYLFANFYPIGHSGNGIDGKTIIMDSGYEITAGGGGGGGGAYIPNTTIRDAINWSLSDVKQGSQGSGTCGVGWSGTYTTYQSYTYRTQIGTNPKGYPIYSYITTYYKAQYKTAAYSSGKCIVEWRQRR